MDLSAKRNQKNSLVALVVDDLPSMRWIVIRRLRELGFSQIIEANSGTAAIEELCIDVEKGSSINIIVSDLNMPDVDGVDFVNLVKSFPEFQKIPFVTIPKPIVGDVFKERVKQALEN